MFNFLANIFLKDLGKYIILIKISNIPINNNEVRIGEYIESDTSPKYFKLCLAIS